MPISDHTKSVDSRERGVRENYQLSRFWCLLVPISDHTKSVDSRGRGGERKLSFVQILVSLLIDPNRKNLGGVGVSENDLK